MKKIFAIFCLAFGVNAAMAQEEHEDSVLVLENIIVHAFESNSNLINTPAAISKVGSRDLRRYDNTTILSAINMKPGVRMDERSPGSYRLNIRGSSMRSPFGVSNVKVYYNGIPFTGPGGSTDLNMLSFSNVRSAEIIKGPAGSMYGAGTGGAVLISSEADVFRKGFSAMYNRGSFNSNNASAEVRLGNENAHTTIGYHHTDGDGYREHTNMRRDVVTLNATLKNTSGTELKSHFLYSNLFYQTPGALTLKEYEANPRSARPKAGIFPSAEEAKAAIYDQAFLAGFSLRQKLGAAWQNTTTLYGYYFRHNNPNFRNYTRRVEPNFGGRTNFQYKKQLTDVTLTMNAGAEFQKNFIISRLYNNVGGTPGAVQTDDEINNTEGFLFAQLTAELSSGWLFMGGASLNGSAVHFNRFSTTPPREEHRNFRNELAPRIAVLKKINPSFSLYASASRGFSSPASSELLPTSGVFNTELKAESGVNLELGQKANFINNRLFVDLTLFRYRLKDAIVQRQDATGGIYYDNAGSTNQQGLEAYLSYALFSRPTKFFAGGMAYVTTTLNDFKYDSYKQLDNDYSGNKIAGIAPSTLAGGIDLRTIHGVSANLTYFYSGRIALNDANSAFAKAYHLAGAKLGYRLPVSSGLGVELFAGVQNLFDERYSLGNDINAAAGRYYNVAAGRNYYAGLSIGFEK